MSSWLTILLFEYDEVEEFEVSSKFKPQSDFVNSVECVSCAGGGDRAKSNVCRDSLALYCFGTLMMRLVAISALDKESSNIITELHLRQEYDDEDGKDLEPFARARGCGAQAQMHLYRLLHYSISPSSGAQIIGPINCAV